jgi:hypothetical protein
MKVSKQQTIQDLTKRIQELDNAITDYELYFDKPERGDDETQTLPNTPH